MGFSFFRPSSDFRYALKEGMSGTDVAVLQLNLQDVVVDGRFGPQTNRSVCAFQKAEKLKMDGIAGLLTQRKLALKRFAEGSAKYKLPTGLLEGIANNESSFALACYSRHPSDPGFDIGVLQHSIPPEKIGSQAQYALGYDAVRMAHETAAKIREQKDKFYGKVGAKTNKRAWELSVLYHNWPTAAVNMASGHGPYLTRNNDSSVPWIVTASGGRLQTPNQWVEAYIQRCCVFITKWTS